MGMEEITANLWHLNRNQFCAQIISPISIDSQIEWIVFNFPIITSSEVLKLPEKDHNPFSPPRVLYHNRLIIVVIIASRPLWGCSALCAAAPPHCKTPLHSADLPLPGYEENQRRQQCWGELRKPRQQQSLVHCGEAGGSGSRFFFFFFSISNSVFMIHPLFSPTESLNLSLDIRTGKLLRL